MTKAKHLLLFWLLWMLCWFDKKKIKLKLAERDAISQEWEIDDIVFGTRYQLKRFEKFFKAVYFRYRISWILNRNILENADIYLFFFFSLFFVLMFLWVGTVGSEMLVSLTSKPYGAGSNPVVDPWGFFP